MKAVIVHLDPLVVPRSTPARAVAGRMERDGKLAQASVLAQLAALRREGHVRHVRALWIANAVAVSADDERHRPRCRARPDVRSIEADSELPIRLADAGTTEPGIGASSAPELWARGIDGSGVTVATLDTGVDLTHPALAGRYRGGGNSWFDPYGEHTTGPVDLHGHGTQVMGVIVAGNGIGHGARRALHRGARLQRRGCEHRQRRPPRVPVAARSRRQPCDRRRARRRECVVGRTACNLRPGVRARPPGLARGAHPAGLRRRERRSRGAVRHLARQSPGSLRRRRGGATPRRSRRSRASGRRAAMAASSPRSSPPAPASARRIASASTATGLAGTSFAAPHVAGALALLLQVAPQLAAGDQASLLTQSAHDLGTPGADATLRRGIAGRRRSRAPALADARLQSPEALGRRASPIRSCACTPWTTPRRSPQASSGPTPIPESAPGSRWSRPTAASTRRQRNS